MGVIPRKAFFCWGGTEMPWIRRASIESFKKQNPAWEVEIVSVSGETTTEIIKNSDIARYKRLSVEGGAYFDTDILFVRPLDELMECINDSDTVVCFDKVGPLSVIHDDGSIDRNVYRDCFYSVASLMCASGNLFYADAARYAAKDVVQEERDHQSCGVLAMDARFGSLETAAKEYPEHRFFNMPRKAFLPVDFDNVRALYRIGSEGLADELMNDPEVFGVHWFGGDNISRISSLWSVDSHWSDCAMGKLLECA